MSIPCCFDYKRFTVCFDIICIVTVSLCWLLSRLHQLSQAFHRSIWILRHVWFNRECCWYFEVNYTRSWYFYVVWIFYQYQFYQPIKMDIFPFLKYLFISLAKGFLFPHTHIRIRWDISSLTSPACLVNTISDILKFKTHSSLSPCLLTMWLSYKMSSRSV